MPNPFRTAFNTVAVDEQRRLQLRRREPSSRNYIIFFIPRSGSTLLRSYLRSVGKLGRPAEYFNIRNFPSNLAKHPARDLPEYLDLVRRARRSENGVFGMKVGWGQLRYIEELADLISLFEERPACVYLRRRNLLLQAVSLARLWQSESSHLRAGDTRALEKHSESSLAYNESQIIRAVTRLVSKEYRMERYLERKQIEPLKIYYEDVVSDTPAVVKRIAVLLGVDLNSDEARPTTNLLKSGTAENLAWAESFRDSHAEFVEYWEENRGFANPRGFATIGTPGGKGGNP